MKKVIKRITVLMLSILMVLTCFPNHSNAGKQSSTGLGFRVSPLILGTKLGDIQVASCERNEITEIIWTDVSGTVLNSDHQLCNGESLKLKIKFNTNFYEVDDTYSISLTDSYRNQLDYEDEWTTPNEADFEVPSFKFYDGKYYYTYYETAPGTYEKIDYEDIFVLGNDLTKVRISDSEVNAVTSTDKLLLDGVEIEDADKIIVADKAYSLTLPVTYGSSNSNNYIFLNDNLIQKAGPYTGILIDGGDPVNSFEMLNYATKDTSNHRYVYTIVDKINSNPDNNPKINSVTLDDYQKGDMELNIKFNTNYCDNIYIDLLRGTYTLNDFKNQSFDYHMNEILISHLQDVDDKANNDVNWSEMFISAEELYDEYTVVAFPVRSSTDEIGDPCLLNFKADDCIRELPLVIEGAKKGEKVSDFLNGLYSNIQTEYGVMNFLLCFDEYKDIENDEDIVFEEGSKYHFTFGVSDMNNFDKVKIIPGEESDFNPVTLTKLSMDDFNDYNLNYSLDDFFNSIMGGYPTPLDDISRADVIDYYDDFENVFSVDTSSIFMMTGGQMTVCRFTLDFTTPKASSSKTYKAKDENKTTEKITGTGKKGSTRTIVPQEGRKVSSVIVTDKDGNRINVTKNADGTYSFVQPAENVDVEVTYKNREITLNIGSTEASVDGERENLDVCPVLRNDRTMLPIRFVAENLGAKVEWEEKNSNYVVITRGDTKIEITLGSDIMKVNGKDVKLDSAAFAENDRTYLPVRAVSEALNAIVEWNENEPSVVRIFERQ